MTAQPEITGISKSSIPLQVFKQNKVIKYSGGGVYLTTAWESNYYIQQKRFRVICAPVYYFYQEKRPNPPYNRALPLIKSLSKSFVLSEKLRKHDQQRHAILTSDIGFYKEETKIYSKSIILFSNYIFIYIFNWSNFKRQEKIQIL